MILRIHSKLNRLVVIIIISLASSDLTASLIEFVCQRKESSEMESNRSAVVLYPSPGMGHLRPMLELGKLFLRRGLPVTLVVVEPPYNTGSTAALLSGAHHSLAVHRLPHISPSDLHSTGNQEALVFELLQLSNPHLLSYLLSNPALALVVDPFCLFALDVAAEVGVPAYLFNTCAASANAVFLHIPSLHDSTTQSYREIGSTPINFPGVPPIPGDHMPTPMLDRDDDAYKGFLAVARRLSEPAGVITNSFEWLESGALEAIRRGLCTPGGKPTPPVYCIGPLIASEDEDDGRAECLAWLDSQPRASVVFLCFGSLGRLSAEQLKEISTGLENSGHGFLWVVRSPPSDDPAERFEKPPEPDLDALLPAGFLERTKERGLVVKSWAPQVSVLAHEAVGGFVTHMGWNSILEALWAGVPMLAWPLYAEQRMNKVFVADGMGLAGVMEGYDRGLVGGAEVEARVRWLMEEDSEGGRKLREKAAAARDRALAALRPGGSSYSALDELIMVWRQGEKKMPEI